MKKLSFIIVLGLLLSCTKGGGNIYVEGKVYNPVTGEGIQGVNMVLSRGTISGELDLDGASFKSVESATSDENGNFKIKHTGGFFDYQVYAHFDVTNYYDAGWANISTKKDKNIPVKGYFIVKKGQNMHADYKLVPIAELKLSIHNVNCQGETDTMWYKVVTSVSSESDDSYGYFSYNGCYTYDSNGFSKVPMGWRVYYLEIKRNGITNHVTDSVYISAGEQKVYSLDY